ncbi:MAG: Mg chelatase family protein [Gammaproteobacteria bacterium]|nr:Mg chelatase family protein [Gammaproteobacteria bacterium]
MSIAIVTCRAQLGLHAPLVQVEVSLGSGLPAFNIVGLPATVVKESRDRVRAALVNSKFEFPAGRITVNLSPADLPKRGGRFDLPIALGILLASEQIKLHPMQGHDPGEIEFYGELGLSGELKSVPGMLLAAAHAARAGHGIVVPQPNAAEVRVLLVGAARGEGDASERVSPIMYAADHLLAVCAHLDGSVPLPILPPPLPQTVRWISDAALDLSDVRGQLQAKRALAVAAAGGHSLLMMGPPGAGKSMLAMRLPTLLPPMTEAESLEVAAIASVSGTGFQAGNFGRRPVRTPHHTASAVALVGGGSRARPGEISLAHHGVLFLDELLEYDRRALEALREPLESGVVSIARATYHTQYPAQFQLVAAMNPCPCGRYGDPLGDCRCTLPQIAQYRARVSAPLLERFDIHLEVPRVDLGEFAESALPSESSAAVVARVTRAREIQLTRQGMCNARLTDAQIDRICSPDNAGRALLDRAMKAFGFSARARQRILKLARTIADLSNDATVGASHVGEAVTYRSFDRRPPPS